MQRLLHLLRSGLLMIVMTHPGWVAAHAVVTQSSLGDAAIAPQTATSVALQFNSSIELGLSQVFLVSKGDKLTRLTIGQGSKPGEIILSIPPLATGEYALKLKVFAADGHLTEDIIRFFVTQ